MKLRCPACGAAMSLEVLIAHDDAREALIALTGISDELTRAMLKYLTLFRPSEKDLSFARVAKLLGELLPMIRAGEISRGRKAYPAPREAWIWAAGRCLEARDKGRLTPPLSSHGFLLENITFWQQQAPAPTLSRHDGGGSGGARNSKLRQGAAALLEWAGNDWLRLEIAQGLTMLSAQNMKGRPAAADMAVVGEMWAQRLAGREAWNEELDRIRIQTAFKMLADFEEWPNVAELIRNLPPRLIPRQMLEPPKLDMEKGRQAAGRLKEVLKQATKGKTT